MRTIDIPLPLGFTSLKAFPRSRERLVNCFNSEGRVLDCPGIEEAGEGSGVCRLRFEFQDLHYQVSGTVLQRVDQSGATADIGSIPGTSRLRAAVSHARAVIVGAGTGGDGYQYDGTTLAQLVDPNYLPSIDVSFMNGHFIYTPQDGGPVFFSDTDAPDSIPANQFFDAEILPDRNLGTINLRQTLYVLGGNSIELFRQQGVLPAPFLRVSGGSIQTGYVSGKVRFGDTFAFIGRDRDQGFKVMIAGQGQALPISNESIDELLNSDYTEAELVEAEADRIQWHGKDILFFHLKRETIAYHENNWFFVQSGVTAPAVTAPWRARHILNYRGSYWCGDTEDGRIGRFVEDDAEYGEAIQRHIEGVIRESDRDLNFSISALEVDAAASVGSEGRVGLSLSRDGKLYGPTMWRKLPAIGAYGGRIEFRYPGGLGTFESMCAYRLSTTDNARLATDNVTIEL